MSVCVYEYLNASVAMKPSCKHHNDNELTLLSEIRCPKLDMPINGGYKCSDGSYFNSRCEFFCSTGFTLKGQKTATCRYNAVWSAGVPSCVGKTVCIVVVVVVLLCTV